MREPGVVAAHALDPGVVVHRVGRVRHADLAAAGEERVHQLPLRRHHDHVQRFGADLRHGDQLVRAQVVDRLEQQIHDHPRLAAGRHAAASLVFSTAFFQSVPKPISRAAFIISRSHQANSFSASAISSSGDVGDHRLRQVLDQPLAPPRRPRDAAVVRLAGRVRIQLQVRPRDLRLRGPANEQVVDLRVSRQPVEVERLERGQPPGIERRVARLRRRRCAAAAAPARAGAGESLDDLTHLVLGQRDDLAQVGNVGGGRRRRRGDRVNRRRLDRHREVLGRHLLAQLRGVAFERLVHLGVGHAHPPGEQRIVAVVEVEPFAGNRPQLLDRGRRENGLVRVDAWR